jgi:hypothetical protein
MKTINTLIIAAAIVAGNYLNAQTTGTIKGSVTADNGPALFMATVKLYDDTIYVSGVATDDKGGFSFYHLVPGDYNMEISYVGYQLKKISKINVDPSQIAYIHTRLLPSDNTLKTAEITETYEPTIVNPTYTTMTAIRLEQIENMPVTKGDIVGIITALTPATLPTDDGNDFHVRGSRSGTNLYIVDGNKVMGSPDVPGLSIGGMEVLTGGIPAEYGDFTGGVVIINTKEYKWEMRRKEMAKRAREEKNKN